MAKLHLDAREGERMPSTSAAPPSIPDHAMICAIGRGAYGEVWLGRNVVGTYRAMKIVYRDRFKEESPYEREFNGIQKYEPLSRSESGLVDILQIGRNDGEGYFYYVMELADDASANPQFEPQPTGRKSSTGSSGSVYALQTVDPEVYVPKTLSQMLRVNQRLSAANCLSLGLSLTRSIGFLHENNLLHRDIKPSNIIFIRGAPKLADIGLLADVSDAHSLVGTEGYIAPEGPNSAQGDIYSFGKVLYEASVGKDRLNFPEPISNITELPDANLLLELNAVTVRACEHDFKHRYPSMAIVRADLELIQEGKSVKRRRIVARRLSLAWKAAAIVTVLGIALGGYVLRDYGRRSFSPSTTRIQIDNAAYWRTESSPRRFDVSPDGAHIVFAHGTSPGLSIWDEATKISRKMRIPGAENWRFISPRWSPNGRLVALISTRFDPPDGEGRIQLNSVSVFDPVSGTLRQLGEEWEEFGGYHRLCWGPGVGELTLVRNARAYRVSLDGRMTLWTGFNVPRLGQLGSFSPDGRWLVFDAIGNSGEPRVERDVWIMPSKGGPARKLTHGRGFDGFPAWAPDGHSICYVSVDDHRDHSSRNLWRLQIDPASGSPAGDPQQLTFDKSQHVAHPKFVGGGDRIAFVAVRDQSTIWAGECGGHMDRGHMDREPAILGDSPTLSPDGDTIYCMGTTPDQPGIYAYSLPTKTLRRITRLVPVASLPSVLGADYDLSPDGEALVFNSVTEQGTGIVTVSTVNGAVKMIQKVDADATTVPRWSPDGCRIAYGEFEGLYVIGRDGGESRKLAHIYRWQSVDWSPDGNHLGGIGYASRDEFEKEDNEDHETNAVFVYSFSNETLQRLTPPEEEYKEGAVWHPDSQRMTYMYYGPESFGAELRFAYVDGRPTSLMFDQEDHWDYVGRWAPDGRRFFFTSDPHEGRNIHVFHLGSGEIEHGLWGGGLPAWSRDGRSMTWTTRSAVKEFVFIENFQ